MAAQIEILINSVAVDYREVEGFPLSVDYAIDPFFDIFSTMGVITRAVGDEIILSGTARTVNAMLGINKADSFSLVIVYAGLIYFGHKGVLKRILRDESGNVSGYAIKSLTPNAEFFGELEGVSMRDLNLGEKAWTNFQIGASWTNVNTNWSGVFAPVLYGTMDGGGDGFENEDLRFHTSFRWVMKGVEDFTQFTLNSSFMEMEYFRRHVNIFGVGEAWKKGVSNLSDNFFGRAGTSYTTPGNVPFNPLQSTDPNWSTNGQTFTFTSAGRKAIEVNLTFPPEGLLHPRVYVWINGGSERYRIWKAGVSKFTIDVKAGDTLSIYQDSGPFLVGNPRSLRIEDISEKPSIGNTIDISSTLHDLPVKDFLRDITGRFNLVWFIDAGRREVIVEPRFDYRIAGVKYAGFYHTTAISEPEDYSSLIDISSVKESISPIGRSVSFSNKKDGSDLYEAAYDKASEEVPFAGVEYGIGDNEVSPKEFVSPYFTDLITTDLTPISGLHDMPHLPLCLPSDFNIKDSSLPSPDYECPPKYAYYAGQGGSLGMVWKYKGTVSSDRPVLYQRTPRFSVTWDSHSASFGNSRFISLGGLNRDYPGYVEMFYMGYLATLRKATILRAEGTFFSADLGHEDGYRKMKKLSLPDGERVYIAKGPSEVKPLENGLGVVELIEVPSVQEEDYDRLNHNSQVSDVNPFGFV